jgi:hypothetical protein
MKAGRQEYRNVLAQLEEVGLPSEFTQTGGMNAAIEVQLETGAHLLITDADDSLAWHRNEQQGWGAGLYSDPEHEDGPERFESCQSNEIGALIELVKLVLLGSSRT